MGGSVIFAWKEDCAKNCKIQQHNAIRQIKKDLLKYASHCHKKQSQKLLSSKMHDKISPGQFRTIYKELTGDYSVSDNRISKAMDERMHLILSVSDDNILRELCITNHRNLHFDDFWAVTKNAGCQ